MTPGQFTILIQPGDTYQTTITWSTASVTSTGTTNTGTPVNLTGASAVLTMYVFGPITSNDTTLNSNYFTNQTGYPYYTEQFSINSTTATAGGSILTLGGTAGTINILITSADTATLQNGQYTLVVTQPGNFVSTVLLGPVNLGTVF